MKGIELPSDAKAYIALKITQTLSNENRSEEKETIISPECLTYKEFVEQIDGLISELKEVKGNGRRFFEREKKKREEWIAKKS